MTLTEYIQLCDALRYASRMYYAGVPVMTDSKYDDEYHQLLQYEEENPEHIHARSPTQMVEPVLPPPMKGAKVETRETISPRGPCRVRLQGFPGRRMTVEVYDNCAVAYMENEVVAMAPVPLGQQIINEGARHE